MRLTWAQPEDLLPNELQQSAAEGKDVDDIAERWSAAGGALVPPRGGASPVPAPPALRTLARALLDEVDARPGAAPEPASWAETRALLPDLPGEATVAAASPVSDDRMLGVWTG